MSVFLIMKNLTCVICIFLISFSALAVKPEPKKEESKSWTATVWGVVGSLATVALAKRLFWGKPAFKPDVSAQNPKKTPGEMAAEAAARRFGEQLPLGLQPSSPPIVTQNGGSSGFTYQTWGSKENRPQLTEQQQVEFDQQMRPMILLHEESANPIAEQELAARVFVTQEQAEEGLSIRLRAEEEVARSQLEREQATAAARHVDDPNLVAVRLIIAVQQMELLEAIQAERQRQQDQRRILDQQIVEYALSLNNIIADLLTQLRPDHVPNGSRRNGMDTAVVQAVKDIRYYRTRNQTREPPLQIDGFTWNGPAMTPTQFFLWALRELGILQNPGFMEFQKNHQKPKP